MQIKVTRKLLKQHPELKQVERNMNSAYKLLEKIYADLPQIRDHLRRLTCRRS